LPIAIYIVQLLAATLSCASFYTTNQQVVEY